MQAGCSSQVVKSAPCPGLLGGCLLRRGRDLCRAGWDVSNPRTSSVPGVVWGAASVTLSQLLLAVPVTGGLSRCPLVLLGFLNVLLLFAFSSEGADLQFPAGHLAKAKSQM